MKHVLLIVLLAIATGVSAQSQPEALYAKVNKHVCTDLAAAPCPTLSGNEQWAFVAMWCEQHPDDADCKTFATLRGGPVVIAFNHDTQAWRAIRGVNAMDVETDKSGAPKVLSSSGRAVIAAVESSNPLLYKADPGAVEETTAEKIAAIQAFLKALGTAITGGLRAQAGALVKPEEKANITAAEKALEKLTCATDHWATAHTFIQRVERRRTADYVLLELQCQISSDKLDETFATIRKAVEPIRGALGIAQKLDEVAKATPGEATTKLKAIDLAIPSVKERFGEFTVLLEDDLAAIAEAKKKQVAVDTKDKKAVKKAKEDVEALEEQWAVDAVDRRSQLRALLDLQPFVTQADELLADAKKAVVTKMVGDIERFEIRLLETIATTTKKVADKNDPEGAIHTAEVPDFFVVRNGAIDVAWDKDRKRSLTITKSSPLSDNIVARRPDSVATSYAAASLTTSLIDLNVSLTHTQLSSPVFGTITEKAATETDPNATKLVIAKKDEEERSGQLAAFLAYPVLRRFFPENSAARRIGVEVGVGATKDQPALFLGVSWKATRAIHLGFGKTWQQVKALDGQKIGEVVLKAEDLKQKNVMDSSWYASFSFSIGSLSLFNKD